MLGVPILVVPHHHSEENGSGRRLGLLERWYTAHHRSGNHTGVIIAVKFASPTNLTTTDLNEILHRVALRMPMLRARMRRDGITDLDATEELRLTAVGHDRTQRQRLWGDDLYLWILHATTRPHVRVIQERWLYGENLMEGEAGGLREILQEENARPWHDEDPSLPLWRVTLVRWKGRTEAFALVISFHHAICDGIGTTAVVEAIVEESGRQHNPAPADEQQILCTKVPPPMEDVLDTVPRLCHIWRPLLLDLIPFLGIFFFFHLELFRGANRSKLQPNSSIIWYVWNSVITKLFQSFGMRAGNDKSPSMPHW
eukprot:scaffold4793_cov175-Amphora_coffeaeformis.AAC.8